MKRGILFSVFLVIASLSAVLTGYQQPAPAARCCPTCRRSRTTSTSSPRRARSTADVHRRQHRRLRHRRRRRRRRHEAGRLGPGHPREDQDRHRQAGDDDHQHAHARRSHRQQRVFPATVDIVAHENTKANMAKMDAFKGDKAQFLPKRTYKDKMTLGSGKDRIDLYYFGAGHTNGDTVGRLPGAAGAADRRHVRRGRTRRSSIAPTAAAASNFRRRSPRRSPPSRTSTP